MDLNQFHQEKIAQIIHQLETACHGLLVDPSQAHLRTLSALELQTELINRKVSDQEDLPLIQAIVQFHDKQLQDRNSHFALTDVLTKSALETARKLESVITPDNVREFPLYGFILSIKESIKIKGYASSCGLVSNLTVWEKPTPLIDFLESKGAVVISRGNVPQMLFAFETSNNIYGATSNPYDKSRTSGGSSGGEAALIALGHVNAGIGSDLAGSLRIPAFFCGICSLHPTPRRVDISTHALVFEQAEFFSKMPEIQSGIAGSIGPMGRRVDDLIILTKELFDFSRLNSRVPPVPYRENLPRSKKIGLVTEWDNVFELTEVNRRATREAVGALKRRGYEVIDFDMRDYILDLAGTFYSLLFKNYYFAHILTGNVPLGEPLMNYFDDATKLMRMPKPAIKFLLLIVRDPRIKFFLQSYYNALQFSSKHLLGKIAEIKQRIINEMRSKGIQELLCPGMMPASFKGTSFKVGLWVMYLYAWNGIYFPAGAVPITRVRKDEQFYNSKYNMIFEGEMRKLMANSEGLPVGVQVVGMPWRDEAVLEIMKEIEDDIKFK